MEKGPIEAKRLFKRTFFDTSVLGVWQDSDSQLGTWYVGQLVKATRAKTAGASALVTALLCSTAQILVLDCQAHSICCCVSTASRSGCRASLWSTWCLRKTVSRQPSSVSWLLGLWLRPWVPDTQPTGFVSWCPRCVPPEASGVTKQRVRSSSLFSSCGESIGERGIVHVELTQCFFADLQIVAEHYGPSWAD